MSVFDLDTAGEEASNQRAIEEGIRFDQLQPGFLRGVGYGTGMGVARGAAKVGRAVALAASVPLTAYEKAAGYEPGEITDSYFESVVKPTDEAVQFYTPNANEVGTAGRVLGGLAEMVAPLAAGAGNPALLIGSTGLNTGADLVQQGVDSTTATAIGTLDAATVGVGFRLPFLGSTLLQRTASGAAANLALGAGATAADRAILDARGYDALAKQYNPLDLEARTVDLLTGIAFGGLAHVQSPRVPTRSERAAALAALNARHFQSDTAPGRPADASALAAHQRALEQALRQIQEDQPIDVGQSGVTEADFLEVPREPLSPDAPPVRAALDELGIRDALDIPRAEALSDADRGIESRFIDQVQRDPDAAIRAYAELPDAQGGKVLNTDTARELSADYLRDRTRSAAVHEPASWLVKRMYERMLSKPPSEVERPLVLFTGGGTGAGKSTAIKDALGPVADVAQIVYDTNMNGFEGSVRKIEQAIAAGKEIVIAYTFRDPIVALREGALPRAMRQQAEFGSGRTVPLSEHLKTHIGARDTIGRLAERYAGDPRVKIKVIDNRYGKGGAKSVSLREIPKFDTEAYNRLREDAKQTLEQERAAGRISEAVYRGFAERAEQTGSAQDAAGSVRGRGDQRVGGQPQSSDGAGKLDPDVAAARQLLEQSDLAIPTGELDADGNPIVISARKLMAAADAEVARAESDGKGFEAAISCLLSFGPG